MELKSTVERPKINQDKEIKRVVRNTSEIAMISENMQVISKEAQIEATNLIKQVKVLKKVINERKEFFTKPFNEVLKYTREQARVLTDPLDEIEKDLREKLITYQNVLEEKKRKEEEAYQIKMEATLEKNRIAQKKIDEGEKAKLAPMPIEKPIEAEKKIKTEESTLSYKTTWKFEIEDPSKIPAGYMVPDEIKIGKVVRDGIREIPGVRIYSVKEASIR